MNQKLRFIARRSGENSCQLCRGILSHSSLQLPSSFPRFSQGKSPYPRDLEAAFGHN